MSFTPRSIGEFYVDLRKLDSPSYRVDRIGRFVICEPVWVKYPWMDSYTLYVDAGEVIDTGSFGRLERKCKEGICYTDRLHSPMGMASLICKNDVLEGRGDKTFQNPSLHEVQRQ